MEIRRTLRFFSLALLFLLASLIGIGERQVIIGILFMILAIGILLWLAFRPESNKKEEDNGDSVG